jgi:predicted nucleotide-binding protein
MVMQVDMCRKGTEEMDDLKSEYNDLVESGERIVNSDRSGPKAAKKWANKIQRWLKSNIPDSGLSENVSLVMPEFRPTNSGRGLLATDRRGVQKILGVLLSSKDIFDSTSEQETSTIRTNSNIGSRQNKVFIVHGHDEALKANTARLIERLGLETVILHEQPNRGRTVIEKFYDHSDVSYAIVLLTSDDVGKAKSAKDSELKDRARQNVIFEMGYFIGSLGRKRVCAIYQEGVELPSDYQGVLYIQHDIHSGWEAVVGKELRDAGLPVDLNKL